jgi:hypothetical protein
VSPRGPHGGPPRCNRATSPRATGDCRRFLLVYRGINMVPYHGPSGRLGSEEERAMRVGGADCAELGRTDDVATLGAGGRTPAHLVRRAKSLLRVAAGRRNDAMARELRTDRECMRGPVAYPLCAGRAGRHRARRAPLEHPDPGARGRAQPAERPPRLASRRAPAASGAPVPGAPGPPLSRAAPRRGRAVPASARACPGAVRRGEEPDPGPRPDPARTAPEAGPVRQHDA